MSNKEPNISEERPSGEKGRRTRRAISTKRASLYDNNVTQEKGKKIFESLKKGKGSEGDQPSISENMGTKN